MFSAADEAERSCVLLQLECGAGALGSGICHQWEHGWEGQQKLARASHGKAVMLSLCLSQHLAISRVNRGGSQKSVDCCGFV